MSGDGFGVQLEELGKIQHDWQNLQQQMASMTQQIGHIKETVAQAAATDLMASPLAGILGFASVAGQITQDVSDILGRAEQLQKTKEQLTKELAEDVEKIKQVAKEYEETERRIHEGVRKHDQHHQAPKSPNHGGGSSGSGNPGSPGHSGGHQPLHHPGHGGQGGHGGHGSGPDPTPPTTNVGKIKLDQVTYGDAGSWKSGEAACRQYINEALDKMGITDPRARENWTRGMLTIASRESSYNAAQINKWDSNAYGPRQADGSPLNCSRGGWQTIPSTFAEYHQAGTSTNIYDPVANVASSMNYIMGRYHVSKDGSDLAERVQQADPNRGPRGY